jgi:hypothetical protein
MCQRAVAATTDKGALIWLCSAALLNVAGGTVRQIAWLGILVMVPSTAWLLRNRHGIKTAVVIMWLFGVAFIIACLHWFNRQPYSVPEPILPWPIHPESLVHLGAQVVRTFLCLLLIVFPVAIAWVTTARCLQKSAKYRIGVALLLLASLALILHETGRLNDWVEPWLIPLLGYTAFGKAYLWIRAIISLLAIAPALFIAEALVSRVRFKSATSRQQSSWIQLAWILGPFSIGYLLLLIPRATMAFIQDRYLLGLAPIAIIVLLKLYQEQVRQTLPAVSFIALIVVAVIALGAVHDFFAASRALTNVVVIVEKSGIPSKSLSAGLEEVDAGWARDGWVQIEDGDHINDARIKVPVGAYRPYAPGLKLPPECVGMFASFTPAIHPKYFVVSTSKSCFAETNYPVVQYKTWFPPFHRLLRVETLPAASSE